MPATSQIQSPENLPEIAAVVFDMDGLMFNTEDLYDLVGDQLLQRRGHRFTPELKQKMMGLPGPEAFEVMREQCQIADSIEVLQRECDLAFVDLLPNAIRLLPGLELLLDLIESLGLPKAIATSSHRDFAERALGCFQLEPRFEFVLTGDDVERGKPHPDIYLKACQQLDVEPAKALVLEDSLNGTLAAWAAGAVVVAVPGHHSVHICYDHADFRVERLDDPLVLRILENSNRSSS